MSFLNRSRIRRLSRALNGRRLDPVLELEHCLRCERDFVYPVEWEPVSKESWQMLLRCGNCDTWFEAGVSNEIAERFDLELDYYAHVMEREWYEIDREKMIAWVDIIINALRHDLIDAADFNR
jgi:transcription elongation factor Elf1